MSIKKQSLSDIACDKIDVIYEMLEYIFNRLKKEENNKRTKDIEKEIAFDLLPLVNFNADIANNIAREILSKNSRIRHVNVNVIVKLF